MATNFTFKTLTVYRETVENTIPTSPVGLVVAGVINCTVKDTQKSETNPTLSNGGQASRKDFGTSDYAGNIENKMIGDMMPFIATHVIGAATTKAAFTTESWAATTAYEATEPFDITTGDVLLHTDATHNLVCKTAGTSGATEPDLAGLVTGDTVTDGTVVWIVRGILQQYTGEMQPCIPTFGAEYSADSGCDGGAETFTKRFEGNFLNSYEISKSNGTIVHKYSLPVVAMSSDDNTSNDAFTLISSEAGYTSQDMNELSMGYDDLKVQIGGAQPTDSRNFRMNINRNVTVEDSLEIGTKVSNIPQAAVDGEVGIKFTKAEYLLAFENEETNVDCIFGKQNGDYAKFSFPTVQKDRVDPDFSTSEAAYLTVPLTASGDSSNATVSYDIVSEIDY